ncbi:homoserine kinase [Bacterioplanoides pacificum]|uniref:Homoserine kinase n=1 Tax=Bacterioplanoides pacificum TaxID=1171596 RepID=A0ABV7VXZ5_9GAMM
MSVYTPLSQPQVETFVAAFPFGELLNYRGIEAGVENTNFFVTTSQGEFVLTIFEQHRHPEVHELVLLAHHLGKAGLQVPAPLEDNQGEWLHTLEGKPAILCRRLPGEHIETPTEAHCYAIGAALAELHQAAQTLAQQRPDDHGLDWAEATLQDLGGDLSSVEKTLLQDEIQWQRDHQNQWQALPSGWIHGDLFHDNALFVAGNAEVGAILDLYHACSSTLLIDVAIVANDWCCDKHGNWLGDKQQALLDGYNSVRPLTPAERDCWNQALRAAALRWWVGRLLIRRKQQRLGAGLSKDPGEYQTKLEKHRQPV